MKFVKTKIYVITILAIAHSAMLSAEFFITNNTGKPLVAVTQLCGSQIIKIGINVPVGKSTGQNTPIPGTCQYTVMTDDGAYYIFNNVFTGKFSGKSEMDINKASSGKGIALNIWKKPYAFDQTFFVDPNDFKEYIPLLTQTLGEQPIKIAPMDPELETALNIIKSSSEIKLIMDNLTNIEKYFEKNPQAVNSRNSMQRGPLSTLVEKLVYLARKQRSEKNSAIADSYDEPIQALKNNIKTLLTTYRANPNGENDDAYNPLNLLVASSSLGLSIPNLLDIIQMLVYSGAHINNAIMENAGLVDRDGNLINPRVYNFLRNWAIKKGLALNIEPTPQPNNGDFSKKVTKKKWNPFNSK